MKIIPFQLALRPVLSTVIGNLEYTKFKGELSRIDELLKLSGIESEFISKSLEHYESKGAAKAWQLRRHAERSVQVLRSMVLMSLLGEDFRGMSRRLAECQLFRDFCRLEKLGVVKVPAKSTLQEYSKWLPEAEMREVIGKLVLAGSNGKEELLLENDLELQHVWMDTTCVETNIHFPIDWVLLKDATRTLMKASALIRKHGLKSRMPPPEEFMTQMNRLCIKMTQSRRKVDSKKQRKAVLRSMKKLVKVVKQHARRHRDLLDKEWGNTDWSRKQAEQVIKRMDGVLEQLPAAEKQAHERIIGERQVKNGDKIFSLYERETQIIVRGKANAEVEFGNTLLLAEQINGVILDWELFKGSAPQDSKLLKPSIKRMKTATQEAIKAVAADRGFDSEENSRYLEGEKVVNAICPKNPHKLALYMKDSKFQSMQKRRSGTEARISILKHSFFGGRLRVKGFASRQAAVAWRVLAHNLWVIARLPRQEEELSLAA